MRLSKRESILVGMLIIILAAIIPFLSYVAPRLNVLIQDQEVLRSMEQQKKESQQVISELNKNQKEVDELQTEAKELYELMDQTKSYDISLVLSEMMARHRITPESLTIEPYQAAIRPGSKGETENGADGGITAAAAADPDAAADSEPAADTGDIKNQPALMRTVDLYFKGAEGDVATFLDEITNYNKSVVVSGFTLSRTQGEEITYEAKINFYEFVEPKVQTDKQTKTK